jgi:hypothetical protein
LDESDDQASRVITLDQVKHKADQILEFRRHSVTDVDRSGLCDVKIVTDCDDCDATATPESDASGHRAGKVEMSVCDETLWQAAERTVTPMWEMATSSDDGVTAAKSADGFQYSLHDKVSGRWL